MAETIALAFLVAKIRGYKLKPIFKHWSIYPVLFMAIVYIYLESTIWQGNYSLIKYSNVFKTIYLSCFLILAVHYDRMKVFFQGMGFMFIGSILNGIAVRANSGEMPVFISNSWSTGYAKPDMFTSALSHGDFHIMGSMYSKMIPLTDIFDIGSKIISVGDIFGMALIFLVIYHSIQKSNNI